MSVSLIPRGRVFSRAAQAIARHGGDVESAAHGAQSSFGPGTDWARIIRGAVSPISLGDLPTDQRASELQEWFELVLQGTIVGRLSGRRDVPFNTRLIRATGGARGYWVSQAAPKPLSKPSLTGSTLPPLKTAAIIVLTRESVDASGAKGEAVFQNDLQRAVTEVIDTAFIDSTNAGVAHESPAAVTYNLGVTIGSTGNPGDDLAELVSRFQGDLSSAYIVSDPVTLTRMALARDAGGSFLFPDLGPRGGSVLGIPVLSSRSSPHDSSGGQLAMIDASALAVGFNGLGIDRAMQATLQMSDDPDNPLDATTEFVSLWQQNLVAMRCEIYANWTVERDDAVTLVTGCNYPSAVEAE